MTSVWSCVSKPTSVYCSGRRWPPEASDVEHAIRDTLDALREATGHGLGHAYLVDHAEAGMLEPTGWWSPAPLQPLAAATANTRLSSGSGLPGRVAASGRAHWVANLNLDDNYPRADAAAKTGLYSSLAFPVSTGSEVVAVIELFADQVREPDLPLLEVLDIVGTQLGRVFEREHALRELHAAAEQRQAIVSIVSHELRGPLATVRNAADLLDHELSGSDSDSDTAEMLGLLRRELSRLQRLVDGLLTAQRIDAHSLRVRPESIRVLDTALQVAADTGIDDIDIRGAHDGLAVLADPDHMIQILWNVLSNAQTHGKAPVTVDIDSQDDDTIAINVRDAGAGVPEAMVPRLFTRFARGSQSTGSGLGLAIARGLARANGGELVYRTPDENGPAFVLTLPSGA